MFRVVKKCYRVNNRAFIDVVDVHLLENVSQ